MSIVDRFRASSMYVWADFEGDKFPGIVQEVDEENEGEEGMVNVGFLDGTGAWMAADTLELMDPAISDDHPYLTNAATKDDAVAAVNNLRAITALGEAMDDDDDDDNEGGDEDAKAARKAARKAEKKAKKEAEKAAAKAEKEAEKAAKAAKKAEKAEKKAAKLNKSQLAEDDDDVLVAPGMRPSKRGDDGADSDSDDSLYEKMPGPKALVGRRAHTHTSTTRSKVAADGLPGPAHAVLEWASDEYVAKLGEIRNREAFLAEQQKIREAELADLPAGSMPPPATAGADEAPGQIVLPVAENALMSDLRRRLAMRASYELAIDEALSTLDDTELSAEQKQGAEYAEGLLSRLRAYHTSEFADVAAAMRAGPPANQPPKRAPAPQPTTTVGPDGETITVPAAKRPLPEKTERHNGHDPLLVADRDVVDYESLKPADAEVVEMALARQNANTGSGTRGVQLMSKWSVLRKKARGQLPSGSGTSTPPGGASHADLAAAAAGIAAGPGNNRYQLKTRGPTKIVLADFHKTQAELQPAPIYSGIQKSASFDDVVPSKSGAGGSDAAPASVFRSATRQSVLPASADIFAQNTPLAGLPVDPISGGVSGRHSVASRASSVASEQTMAQRDALENWRAEAKALVRKVLTWYLRGTNDRPLLIHSDSEFQALGAKLLARLSQRVIDSTGAGASTRAGGANAAAAGVQWTDATAKQIVASVDAYMKAQETKRKYEDERAARREHDPRRNQQRPPLAGPGRGLALDTRADSYASSGGDYSSSAYSTRDPSTRHRPSGPTDSAYTSEATGSKRGRSYSSYSSGHTGSSYETSSYESSSGHSYTTGSRATRSTSAGSSSSGSSRSSSASSVGSSSAAPTRKSAGRSSRFSSSQGSSTGGSGTSYASSRSTFTGSTTAGSTSAASSSAGSASAASNSAPAPKA